MAQVLQPFIKMFSPSTYPELLVGLDISDDAAVYKMDGQTAIIHTLDFFTPVVDNPYDYGAIAAANALSDVYAMGGEVLCALNICCFPPDLPLNIINEISSHLEKIANNKIELWSNIIIGILSLLLAFWLICIYRR